MERKERPLKRSPNNDYVAPEAPSRRRTNASRSNIQERLQNVCSEAVPESERSNLCPRAHRIYPVSELREAFSVEDPDRLRDVGKTGERKRLLTNFFAVDRVPSFRIYNYAVFFDPECSSRLCKAKMLKSIARQYWKSAVHSFSGQSVNVAQRIEVLEYTDVHYRNTTYKVRLQETGETVPGTEPFISILGLVYRGRLSAIGFQDINRNMFDMSACRNIEGFDLYPGIRSSILPRENGRLLLCIDRLNKVVNRQTVSSLMARFQIDSLNGRARLKDALLGASVMTIYNHKFYRICDIDFEKNGSGSFQTAGGREITYVEYYREQYKCQIKSPQLPLLVSKVKGRDGKRMPIHLIAEFCQVAGLDNVSAGDRAKIMRSLCRETIPTLRMQYIDGVLQRLEDKRSCNDDEGHHFPLEIGRRPLEVESRRLPPTQPGTPSGSFMLDWRDIGRKTVFRVVALQRWILLAAENVDVRRFIDMLMRNMNELGIKPSKPSIHTFSTRSNDIRAGEELLARISDLSSSQLVAVIVSNNASPRFYANLKAHLCETYGVPSQFIRERNFREPKMSVIGKIGVQIATKTGSEPWTIGGGFGSAFEGTMVVGIDCHHGSRGQSVSAIVCSLNKTMSKFYSRCFFQEKGQELTTSITPTLKSALERYARQNNKRYPTSIIIFRDGIGDGQLQYIGQSECQQVIASFNTGDSPPPPKLTYIVVKKRLNARFFSSGGGRCANELLNPEAGTVIDTVVTMERWRDFYMVPQKVTQGTATPSHFNVLADHNQFSLDDLQSLTFKLSHMYFNWSGAIRVPAVCQYAHKLAFLVGTCCKHEPKDNLAEKLYYL